MSGRRRWRYPASLAARSFPRCFRLQRAVADSMSCRFPDSAPGGGDWSAAVRACGFFGGGECHIPGPVAAGCRNNRSYDSTERSLSRRIGVVVSVCCAGANSRGRRAGGLTRAPAIESETADISRFLGTEIETQGFAASRASSAFLRAVPPPYPPNAPVLRITRWQGIRYEIGFWATATTSRM